MSDRHRVKRWQRARPVRARTIRVKRLSMRERVAARWEFLAALADGYNPDDRPVFRSDCSAIPRPCPYVGCKYNLYLDVSVRTGAIRLNFPDLEPWEMSDSCALDLAERGRLRLEDVGARLNVVRERVRQIELTALAKLERLRATMVLREYVDEGPIGRRRLPVLVERRPGW